MAMVGGCLCGAVRYQIEGEPAFFGSCYCLDCQKETGSGHAAIRGVPAAQVQVTGALKAFTRAGGSGQPLTRRFCTECGTTVVAEPSIMPGVTMVRLGTLDDSSDMALQMAVFASRARPWDQAPEGLMAFPEMPPM